MGDGAVAQIAIGASKGRVRSLVSARLGDHCHGEIAKDAFVAELEAPVCAERELRREQIAGRRAALRAAERAARLRGEEGLAPHGVGRAIRLGPGEHVPRTVPLQMKEVFGLSAAQEALAERFELREADKVKRHSSARGREEPFGDRLT